MTLPQRLAIESLLSDINELNKAISRLNFEYPGPSWKYPNKQANDFEIGDVQKFEYSENSQENVLIQMGLLEILVDRLHFLLLSSTETKAEKFVSIGRASRILISKLLMLHEGAQVRPY